MTTTQAKICITIFEVISDGVHTMKLNDFSLSDLDKENQNELILGFGFYVQLVHILEILKGFLFSFGYNSAIFSFEFMTGWPCFPHFIETYASRISVSPSRSYGVNK